MADTLRVLQSFPVTAETTNPYVTQLHTALQAEPAVDVLFFDWRTAMTTRIDVFHAHWPEALIEMRQPVTSWLRRALYLLLLLKLRVTRAPIVRTVHNLELPQGMGRVCDWLLRLTERWTTLRITINPITELPAGQVSELILHGHYRDWFAPFPHAEQVAGRVSFFGRIRRYKNVDGLISAFRQIPADDAHSLHITGLVSSADLERQLRELAAGDDRIRIHSGHASDADLVSGISETELVVLPYPEMHNSGSVLAALSLDRPVLVPDNEVNRALAEEVGAAWIIPFTGRLAGQHILDAVAGLDPGRGRPDLSRREWSDAGVAHVRAYRRAIALRRS